jgi:hypothetical protein
MAMTLSGDTGIVEPTAAAPSFSAYNSSATTLTNGGSVKVGFTTEEWDTNSNYDAANSKFQPTVAGYYFVSANVTCPNNAILQTILYKNGSAYKNGVKTSSSVLLDSGISCLVSMNGSTDYLEVYQFNSGTANTTTTGSANTYFQASFVRSA